MKKKTNKLWYGVGIISILIIALSIFAIGAIEQSIYGFDKTVYNVGETVDFKTAHKIQIPQNTAINLLFKYYAGIGIPQTITCTKTKTYVNIYDGSGEKFDTLESYLSTSPKDNGDGMSGDFSINIPKDLNTNQLGTWRVQAYVRCLELNGVQPANLVVSEISNNHFGVLASGAGNLPQPSRCTDKPCAGWDSTYMKKCYDGDIYYYDCCDIKRNLVENCDDENEYCLNAECIPKEVVEEADISEEEIESVDCSYGFNGDPYCSAGRIVQLFYDDLCEQQEKVVEECEFGCENALCLPQPLGTDENQEWIDETSGSVGLATDEQCTADSVQICADGDELTTAECIGGVLKPVSDAICPEQQLPECSGLNDLGDDGKCGFSFKKSIPYIIVLLVIVLIIMLVIINKDKIKKLLKKKKK